MSLLKGVIESLAAEGAISKDVPINKMVFKISILSTEEQILADSIIKNNDLKKKYTIAEGDFSTLPDTLSKYRTLSVLCYAIRSIDGVGPVDTNASLEEQHKQRMEFRDELQTLDTPIIDKLMKEYNGLFEEQRKFYADIVENAGK